MKTITDMIKGYYTDKKKHPWHKLNANLGRFIKAKKSKAELTQVLIPMRAAVFGALDILSFGLIHEISTEDIIKSITAENSWKLGRRNARNLCVDIIDNLIAKGKTRYLSLSALKRDGFGFLIPKIEEKRWKMFKKAKPKEKDGKLNLKKLEKSLIGSKFLREQMIVETEMDAEDSRAAALLDAYELELVEIEVNRSSRIAEPAETEQVTLNGKPVFDDDEKESKTKRKSKKGDQAPLTDFIGEEKKPIKSSRKRKKRRKKSKKGGRKK